jgi:hypothetical protein
MRGRKAITKEMLASIPALLAEGLTKDQIAERFGVKRASLIVICSRNRVSLRRHPRMPSLRLTDAPLALCDRRALHDKAQKLGIADISLVTRLLNAIIRDDLFVAVLDTKGVRDHEAV